jgi:hypothetical protein
MKGLVKYLILGAGMLVASESIVNGTGSLPVSLAEVFYSDTSKSCTNCYFKSKSDSLLGVKDKSYSDAEMNLITVPYTFYHPKLNQTFLDEAKKIDSVGGKKYRTMIDDSYWLEQTKGLIDGNLAYSLGIKESSANPKAVQNRTGARGFWQIMEKTWKSYTNVSFDKAFDFKLNQKIAAKNFGSAIAYLENKVPSWNNLSFEEKRQLAIIAHNWGQGSVVSYLKKHNHLNKIPFESRDMLDKVFSYANYLASQEDFKGYSKDRLNLSVIESLQPKEIKFVYPKP